MQLKPSMFYGASPEIMKRAKDLRDNSTKAEMVFWELISNKKFHGLKFRQQHPIALFVADFYCHSLRLVIEIDGGIHNEVSVIDQDAIREEQLKHFGLRVIRFTNEQVLKQPDEVLRLLSENIGLTPLHLGEKRKRFDKS